LAEALNDDPTPTPPTPTPTPPSPITTAIDLLKNSPTGLALYNMLVENGFTIQYGPSSGDGSNGSHISEEDHIVYIYHGATSPADIAGTIAHEAMHLGVKGNSLMEEYNAMAVGDTVRNDIFVNAGVGTGARHSLNKYTVDVNNPDRLALSVELINWFSNYEKKYVTLQANGGYCQTYSSCPPLP
jgi:hypothetical protein